MFTSPPPASPLRRFLVLSLSLLLLCAPRARAAAASAAYDWGYNPFDAALGAPVVGASSTPVAVSTTGVLKGKNIIGVAQGTYHSLALADDGKVYAWGGNGYGQLGDQTTINRAQPVAVDTSGVLAGKTVVAVAASGFLSAALTSDGKVYTWGYNGYGALGNNSGFGVTSTVPVAVSVSGVLNNKTVTAIAAGGDSGWILALDSDGKVYAWGDNGYGYLGTGGPNAAVPQAVDMTGVLSGKVVTKIAAGGRHSLVVTSDGQVFGWGVNNSGQLGVAAGGYEYDVPVATDMSGVLAGKKVVAIAGGYLSTLAVADDGRLYAWGANNAGRLGDGTTVDRATPVAVDMTGALSGFSLASVSCGYEHSMAVSTDGLLFAWGGNSQGQLGTGDFAFRKTPVAVSGANMLAGQKISALSPAGNAMRTLVAAYQSVNVMPVITVQPAGSSVAAGAPVSFSVTAYGGNLAYQWRRYDPKGVPHDIKDATDSVYSIASASSADEASYDCVVTNTAGTATSNQASLAVAPDLTSNPNARLINISTRSIVQNDPNAQIAGFALSGSGPGDVLIRANGPSLDAFRVAGTMADPVEFLYDQSHPGVVVAQNDDWVGPDVNSTMSDLFAQVGAFGWTTGSLDAALVATLNPGVYTAVVVPKSNSGLGLVEVYETSHTGPRLINISTRSLVGKGANAQIAGFVIAGAGLKTVLLRASGPALQPFSVAGYLDDPVMDLYDQSDLTAPIASNDDWYSDTTKGNRISTAATGVHAFAWGGPSKDAALLVTLPPGNYTAQVQSKALDGVGLIEVYEVNP